MGLTDDVEKAKNSHVGDDLDSLYRRITSPASRKAADLLFRATTDDLRVTYQAGKTVTNNKAAHLPRRLDDIQF